VSTSELPKAIGHRFGGWCFARFFAVGLMPYDLACGDSFGLVCWGSAGCFLMILGLGEYVVT
jgi:hypothetical protein